MLEKIKELFRRENLSLSEEQARKFEVYLRELLRWNRVHNLTAIKEPEEIIKRHFVESVSLIRCFEEANLDWKGKEFADIGTGAGFPGVPLKIYLGDVRLFLVEASSKKCSFLEYLKVKLNEEYEVLCERAENLSRSFDVVLSRALGEFEEVYELLESLSRGYIFVMKGKDIKREWIEELGYNLCELKLSFIPRTYVLWKAKG